MYNNGRGNIVAGTDNFIILVDLNTVKSIHLGTHWDSNLRIGLLCIFSNTYHEFD